jgi:hypothetical protein
MALVFCVPDPPRRATITYRRPNNSGLKCFSYHEYVPKKVSHAEIIGEQGVNLIQRIVLEMGFVWHATKIDAGIDGYIEIRDPTTGEVTNCIIQVQSKATERAFESETRARSNIIVSPEISTTGSQEMLRLS